MGNNSNTEGGPHQTTEAPHGACEGCEKGKSKRLPFPTSWSRAKWPLDLVHSNLDKMPVLSIGTATSQNSSVVDEAEAEVIDVDVDRVQAEEESDGDDQAELSQWKFY